MKHRQPAHLSRRGLTLVEVLAVVVILGLIAGTLAVGFSGTFGRAKTELARTGIGLLRQKVETYWVENDRWPSNEEGLQVLTDGAAVPGDSYFVEPGNLLDPWKNPYIYATPGPDGRPYEIISYGADGQPGGTGEDQDISSATLAERPNR